jgi:hypothetical protein
MARKFSTGLRNMLLGNKPSVTGTDIAGVSTNTITQVASLLGVFQPGDVLLISGSSESANNDYNLVVSVNSAGASMVMTNAITTDGAGDTWVLTAMPKGFRQIFTYGILEIRSGAQPSDADQAETGTLLARITVSSVAVVPGVSTNGLLWAAPDGDDISKTGVWSGTVLADGTAGWFRFYTNMYQTGASTSYVRFDGSCGTSGAQLIMSTTSLVTGAPLTIDTFTVSMAA